MNEIPFDDLVTQLRERGVEMWLYNHKWIQTRGRFQTQLEAPMAWASEIINKLGSPDAERPAKLLIIRL